VGGKSSHIKINLNNHYFLQTPPPHPYGLPAASRRTAFGFALAIARTKALDWLAYASASRLDPTPAVTACLSCPPVCRAGRGRHADRSVGFSQTDICLPQRPLPAPLESLLFNGVCPVRKFTFQWDVPAVLSGFVSLFYVL